MRKDRVCISGIGAITHLGSTADETYKAVCEKKMAFETISSIDGLRMKHDISAGVIDAQLKNTLRKHYPKTSMNLILALSAASEALTDAFKGKSQPIKLGLIVANNDANTDVIESRLKLSSKEFSHSASAAAILPFLKNQLAIEGLAFVVHNTCASFNAALDMAIKLINTGVHDSVLVGGADMLSSKVMFGFDTLRALSVKPCKPFCLERGTITISEGAAFVVVERLADAQKPYCEILGVGRNNDANHSTSPTIETVRQCHELAAHNSEIQMKDVNVIFAHGTATKANDATEARIIKESYSKAKVFASKAVLGHAMATCGAVNAVLIAKSYQMKMIPGNSAKKSELEFDLNWIETEHSICSKDIIQSNSFGFGGNNAIALFRGVQ